MDFRKLNEEIQKFIVNEISDELKNKVINARKKQLADLEKKTDKTTQKFDKKLADKEQEKAKNMKHKASFERRLYRPVPVCKINGSLAQWEFYYPDKGYHQEVLCFKMTGMPLFSDTHGYPYFTATRKDNESSVSTYFKSEWLNGNYEYLLNYLENNLEEINSIEIIDNQLKGMFYDKFGYHIRNIKAAEEFLQKCPDLKNYAKYASKNESYKINEISDKTVKSALRKANKNIERNDDSIKKLNKEKEAHLRDSEEKLNRLRNKINDLEGMRDKKDVEQRKQRRNYTQASYTDPEQDETIAKKKLRARKNELPRQYGDCLYSLRTEDDLLLKYNPVEKVIEVWSNRDGVSYEFGDYTYGDVSEEYDYDFNKSTLENVLDIVEQIFNFTDEIENDEIDTRDSCAEVSGIKVLWRDFNDLDLEDPKTYNIACFILRYYSDERYHFC